MADQRRIPGRQPIVPRPERLVPYIALEAVDGEMLIFDEREPEAWLKSDSAIEQGAML